eukprot:scaffold54043_cov41-Prasinocladus_malaysianus.AAC.3
MSLSSPCPRLLSQTVRQYTDIDVWYTENGLWPTPAGIGVCQVSSDVVVGQGALSLCVSAGGESDLGEMRSGESLPDSPALLAMDVSDEPVVRSRSPLAEENLCE